MPCSGATAVVCKCRKLIDSLMQVPVDKGPQDWLEKQSNTDTQELQRRNKLRENY